MITDAERRARLAHRHRLHPARRSDDVGAIATDLVALHSSDPVTVYLSLAARSNRLRVDDVERALYVDRSLVRHHAMRRTLWVLPRDLVRIVHAAATIGLVGPQRRALAKLLVDNDVTTAPDQWLAAARHDIVCALARRGEASARELGELVPHLRTPLAVAAGTPYAGTVSAHTRVLTLLGFEGHVVRSRPVGTWLSGQYRWTATETWLGRSLGDGDPLAAASTLTAAYLRRFGPATTADVQWWTGWTKARTVAALGAADARPVELEHGSGWSAPDDETSDLSGPDRWVALLPGLDPTTMGWRDRDWYVERAHVGEVFDRNGNAGPTVWADGRVVGGWAQRDDGEITVELLTPLPRAYHRLLDAEVERLRSFIGDARFTVRFPSPLGRRLAVA